MERNFGFFEPARRRYGRVEKYAEIREYTPEDMPCTEVERHVFRYDMPDDVYVHGSLFAEAHWVQISELKYFNFDFNLEEGRNIKI